MSDQKGYLSKGQDDSYGDLEILSREHTVKKLGVLDPIYNVHEPNKDNIRWLYKWLGYTNGDMNMRMNEHDEKLVKNRQSFVKDCLNNICFDPFISIADTEKEITHNKYAIIFRLSTSVPGNITVSRYSFKQNIILHMRFDVSSGKIIYDKHEFDKLSKFMLFYKNKYTRLDQ